MISTKVLIKTKEVQYFQLKIIFRKQKCLITFKQQIEIDRSAIFPLD